MLYIRSSKKLINVTEILLSPRLETIENPIIERMSLKYELGRLRSNDYEILPPWGKRSYDFTGQRLLSRIVSLEIIRHE